ncbi:MAG: rhodanese-like domain-containing protein [Gammaproteobacteria bacterium]|nr:rhodanese-like domain-containing protein [Gammaproteobacteria bacterium]MDH5692749.1 rhodanese-like domain-containing protein [Gammaproteobacteria bacterium]
MHQKVINTLLIVLMGTVLIHPASASSKKELQPESTPGAVTILAEQMLGMMEKDQSLVVVDARVLKGRKKGYIENSIHLPDIETNCDSLAKIETNVDKPMVFYCSSNTCGRSLNAVKKAISCGYKQVYWFRGGFKEWKAKGYPYKAWIAKK